jgi:hypothetical protein
MVPTLRVVTHSMTLCVIRDVARAVRLWTLKKRTETTGLRAIESPTVIDVLSFGLRSVEPRQCVASFVMSSNLNNAVMFTSLTRSTLVETKVEVIHEHCRERETES